MCVFRWVSCRQNEADNRFACVQLGQEHLYVLISEDITSLLSSLLNGGKCRLYVKVSAIDVCCMSEVLPGENDTQHIEKS